MQKDNFRMNYIVMAILGRLAEKVSPEIYDAVSEHFLEELRPYEVVEFCCAIMDEEKQLASALVQ
jgi:hypothetical protein